MHSKISYFKILNQPDDETCGPTSLHAVYNYYHDFINLQQVIDEVTFLEEGGTLGNLLGIHALKRGYKAKMHSYNLNVFDPVWSTLTHDELIEKLKAQLKYKRGKKFENATHSYIEFLTRGGEIAFEDLTVDLIRKYLDRRRPILTGLSATYLYDCKREYANDEGRSVYDDLKGYPMGHFVVLTAIDEQGIVSVSDPYQENPLSGENEYKVDVHRLINSILLGIVTYDANLLILEPTDKE
jgi:hypothetical protein